MVLRKFKAELNPSDSDYQNFKRVESESGRQNSSDLLSNVHRFDVYLKDQVETDSMAVRSISEKSTSFAELLKKMIIESRDGRIVKPGMDEAVTAETTGERKVAKDDSEVVYPQSVDTAKSRGVDSVELENHADTLPMVSAVKSTGQEDEKILAAELAAKVKQLGGDKVVATVASVANKGITSLVVHSAQYLILKVCCSIH